MLTGKLAKAVNRPVAIAQVSRAKIWARSPKGCPVRGR
jgi:hypothetical protein